MKFVWILVGLALIIDATYSVPVETETTKGNTEHMHIRRNYYCTASCDTTVIHNINL